MSKRFCKLFLAIILLSNVVAGQVKYSNPILAGFYSDPSWCRVGSDYYLVTSTFAYFPGLPIFHSKDLVNWEQIGNAMNRNAQLVLTNAKVSGGLFAPTIRYHDGLYYIMCTNVSKGGNFMITAKKPGGPWSDPIYTPAVNGIDPSLFFDDDGKVYITYNSVAPDNLPLYDGHRTIRLFEYDTKLKKTIGQEKIIVNGGTDLSKHPIWIEGPHLYKIRDWYYLMCAEGGTSYDHSEVIFRSKTVDGPFESYKGNPILTQRTLDPKRKNPVTSTGHADLVQTPEGRWYAVFLGCRPYEDDYYNTGRETFMAPVSWKDGWPTIIPADSAVHFSYPVPYASTKKVQSKFSGNYGIKEDFKDKELNNRFVFLRNPSDNLYRIRKGHLEIPLKKETVSGKGNPAFIGFRQAHLKCTVDVRLMFEAKAADEKAGLLIFQNDKYYYYLCKSIAAGQPVVQLFRAADEEGKEDKLLASAELKANGPVQLKIVAGGPTYDFYYAEDKGSWKLLSGGVDGKILSTKTAGGFVGAMFAMYATSNGLPTVNKADYDWFEYRGDDEVYKKLQ